PDVCGGDPTMPNQCACPPQPDEEFCARHRRNCGTYSAMDNCGDMRTADCGSCADPSVCDPDRNVCDCAGQTDQQFCDDNGAECGEFSGTDACGNPKVAGCGSCPGTDVCGPDNTCQP